MKFYVNLLILNINFIFSFVRLPFKTFKSNDINNLYYNYLYINLDIGIPKQKEMKIILKQGKYSFFLYDNNKYTNVSYDNKYSQSYRRILDEKFELSSSSCSEGLFSQETFYIQNEAIENFTFILCSKVKTNEFLYFDGEIGLNLEYESPPSSNFIQVLKDKEIINNYIYSINYMNEEEGYLLIGEYPHKVKMNINIYQNFSNFNENNLYWIKSLVTNYNFFWTILFDKISYGDGNVYQAQREARFSIETKYIISSSQYYNIFREIN